MKFFIDTADVEEIKKAHEKGWVDGVTTNPSLIAKTGRSLEAVVHDIAKIVDGPISAEVISLEANAMYKEGLKLAELSDQVVIKVPMCEEGLVAVRRFAADGIKTNVTLVFSAIQALMAAKAGATFVSPFVGRLDDVGTLGMEMLEQIVQIYRQYHMKTEILAASIRHPAHILEAAMMGVDVATIPYNVMQQLCKHPLTDIGIKKFLEDHEKSIQS